MKTFATVLLLIGFAYQISDIIANNGHVELACDKWTKSYVHFTKMHFTMTSSAYVYFENMDQLNISCNQSLYDDIYFLGLISTNKNFLLESNFDIRPLLSSFSFIGSSTNIEFHNLKGFNLNQNNHMTLIEQHINEIDFIDSYFDFYLNDTQLITKELCVRSNFEHTILNVGEALMFLTSYYSKNVCPYVFMKSTLKNVTFFEISNSLIYKNQLEFLPIDEWWKEFDSPSIMSLILFVSYEHITSKLINQNIFKNVVIVLLQGNFYDIQVDLFESFKHLKEIYLVADNLEVLFAQGIAWMNSLNNDVNQSLAESMSVHNTSVELNRSIYLVFQEDAFNKFYTYPDEDLCLFKEFPHQQLVFPLIASVDPIPCTCTIFWLVQYAEIYKKYDNRFYEDLHERLHVNVCQEMQCNFTQRLAKCFHKNPKQRTKQGFFGGTNLVYHLKLLQYIAEVFLQPFFCFIAILTNSLVILTLRNRERNIKKHLVSSIYIHIQVNAWFNIVYALIKLTSLMNICIYPRTSFCSDIYKLPMSQFFKIYVVYFLGNTMRLCCNCSYICFSVSRYFLSTSNPSRLFQHFQNLNVKLFYSIVLAFNLGLSLFKVFQYKISYNLLSGTGEYPFDGYGVFYCNFPSDLLSFKSFQKKCELFVALNMVNNIFNNILFFFISILIDVGLIRFTNHNLERKKHLFNGEETLELTQAKKLKEKVNKMIVTNGLLYFMSHAPEFVMALVILVFEKRLSNICLKSISCVELIDITHVFSFISMCFQILIFKKFDSNFCMSLENVLDRTLYKCKINRNQ